MLVTTEKSAVLPSQDFTKTVEESKKKVTKHQQEHVEHV